MRALRKKVYVDAPVQGALAARIVMHWGIFFSLMTVSLFTLEWFLSGTQRSVGEHIGEIWNKYAFFFLLMLAVLPTFIYDTVKLSHRFAGPIMRLRDGLKQLADGEQVRPIKFRENDFWRDMSDDFNRVAVRLKAAPVSADGTVRDSSDTRETSAV